MKVIVISGTPGTGKTLIAKKLSEKISAKVISLSEFAVKKDLILSFDSKRDTYVIDEHKIVPEIINLIKMGRNQDISNLIIEGHLTDIIPEEFIDLVIVLRCEPDILNERLKLRGYSREKINENVQSEILGNCANFFVEKEMKKPLLEIDTSTINIDKLVNIIVEIISRDKNITKYRLGSIDWLEKLSSENRLEEYFDT
ncbi:MAG: adenylate kinase family protein [Candidatus Lokiarchaeota archaeon]|nr:adenylate kinase family protein [Candidatus Lokiarchaeota archaeon]